MEFYNRSNRPKTTPANPGTPEEPVYETDIDLRGHKFLVKTGMTSTYNRIQESLEETKIENILRRALGGDETALAVMHGQYVDVTDAPKTLAEMQQLVIKATNQFNELPLEIREKFNFDPGQFVAEYGTHEWAKKMEQPKTLGEIQAASASAPAEGKKEDSKEDSKE